MRSDDARRQQQRTPRFEELEPRAVMAADLAADFHTDYVVEAEPTPQYQLDKQAFLSSAYAWTGLNTVRNEYGFRGAGQTVAVIDTGIAWDHVALGGGFGANYRVVGGYDFAEDDTNPYDDGRSGSHGTHVAGIVGVDSGVASDVDLVALRVFNDNGDGYFSWVESALKWVHEHRNDFANPITTVNLSIGTSWNASTIPKWASLEDEFAQLKADGIFVSVAAGNSFTKYNEAGLSYPAASSYVVPVASVDAGGGLSSFSQRLDRAILAPGRGITSTVPDYVGNQNGRADDYASYSGTSMASPFIAGASVLIREAMQFVGRTNITQDSIYTLMRETGDKIFDAATQQKYRRINLQRAIESLLGPDDIGSTASSAELINSFATSATARGMIGSLSDQDFFRFTAATSGTLTVSATTTNGMLPDWTLDGGGGVVSTDGKSFTFEVVAGRSYSFAIGTQNAIGSYTLRLDLEAADEANVPATNLGSVEFTTLTGESQAAVSWYRIQASRTGTLTAESFAHAGSVTFELYDRTGNSILATSNGSPDHQRLDLSVTKGDVVFLKVIGSSSDFDLHVANLVAQSGNDVTVFGTDGDDDFTLVLGTTHVVSINGMTYEFDSADVSTLTFRGGIGADTATITASTANDTVTFTPTRVDVASDGYAAYVFDTESVTVNAGGGRDAAWFQDSEGNDVFTSTRESGRMNGPGYDNFARGFDLYYASASLGKDKSNLSDSDGDNVVNAEFYQTLLSGDGIWVRVRNFERVNVIASGGQDIAYLYDTSGDDTFRGFSNSAVLSGSTFSNTVQGFDLVYAYASKGNDTAYFYDTPGDDQFTSKPGKAKMSGDGFYNAATNFDSNVAFSTGGNDVATQNGAPRNELFSTSTRPAATDSAGFRKFVANFAPLPSADAPHARVNSALAYLGDIDIRLAGLEQLIRQAAEADTSAFDVLFRRYGE